MASGDCFVGCGRRGSAITRVRLQCNFRRQLSADDILVIRLLYSVSSCSPCPSSGMTKSSANGNCQQMNARTVDDN